MASSNRIKIRRLLQLLVCLLAFACSDESLGYVISGTCHRLICPNLVLYKEKAGAVHLASSTLKAFSPLRRNEGTKGLLAIEACCLSCLSFRDDMPMRSAPLCKPREHNRGENVVKLTKQANIKGCFSWTLTDNICTGLHYYIQLSYPSH